MKKISFIILITAIIFCGCKNPFKTRNSPEPTGPRGTWYPPTTPETVVDLNLRNTYEEKIIDNYLLCFSDSFSFSAPEDSLEAIADNRPELFWNWDLAVERNVTFAIFNQYMSGSLRFVLVMEKDPDQPDIKGDTTAILYRNYLLYLYDFSQEEPLVGTIKGISAFYLRESSYEHWSIYLWQDRPLVSGEKDWAFFKAGFRE
ncbi:MAG: hypothetical protein OEV55_03615 [candidate division Zixibacteria bacterium]|nr:hypothetical protein [candidate division Zixibacteria bacterium]